MKIRLLQFFLIVTVPVFQVKSQPLDREYISKKVLSFKTEGEYDEAVNFLLDLLSLDEAKLNERERTFAKLEMANVMWIIHKYDECLHYLVEAEKDLKRFNDPDLTYILKQEYAQYYYQIGLLGKSLEKSYEAVEIILKIPDVYDWERKVRYVYGSMAYRYMNVGMIDSALHYVYKAQSHMKYPMETVFLFNYHLNNNSPKDSIDFYFERIKKDSQSSTNTIHDKFFANICVIDYHLKNGQFEQALPLIEGAIEVAERINRPRFLKSAYFSMIQYNRGVGNEFMELVYLSKLIQANVLLNEERLKGFTLALETTERLSEERELEIIDKNKKTLFMLLLVFSSSGVYLLWVIQKRKRKIILFEENLDKLKEERVQLERIVESSCEEVIKMAKDNDPAFLPLFKEYYNTVFVKLDNLNPSLSSEEFKLCAMIYLDFSTKEIAKSTFVQVKTVQMKKYRLRKKLDIDSSVDLSDWVKSL
ncbi:helix-turn-helix transcriptional regulator [Mongoliibacter ruber]|uniref:Regulatory LuxR family protein n=1 Tax=Mongoliibacter ruber TaxID=1750599 RepID=A0A2T0WDR1_9BACT|nr:LuxR C-terminal-related transcriptional regulator [Mongoliibacter ruber]PRY84786.1 regulatory LuxR family protein [Mongoliibacter ruber]